VNHTARSAKTSSLRTGLFAIGAASLRAKGSGAPAHRRALSRRGAPSAACFVAVAACLAIALAVLLTLAATPAQAALVFQPNGTIAGTPGGPFSSLKSESVAVNVSNGHILVADSGVGLIYDFASAADPSPGTWDGSITPSGSFGAGSVAVAVDNSTGDVYVSDSTHGVIDKFTAAGALIASFGDTEVLGVPTPNGQLKGIKTPAGEFLPATSGSFGIAVDQATHDLYAIDAGHGLVDIFDSTGAFLTSFDGSNTSAGSFSSGFADGIAVDDQNNHIYISDSSNVRAYDFASPTDPTPLTLDGSNTPAGSFGFGYISIAADNSSGRVYVPETQDSVVDAFDSSGGYLAQITGTPGGSFAGVIVDQTTGDVFVSDNSSGAIKIYTPLLVPDVTTNPATAIGATTATLNGHLDPAGNGDVTGCHFEYTDDASFQANGFTGASTAPCAEGNSFSAPADVHADLTGLTAGTTYHFRLGASNANGANFGADTTLSTLPPPSIDAISAANITPTDADLTATINPRGSDTTYRFEWGTADCAANPCTAIPVPDADIGAGTTGVAVSQHISGLSANTTYHFRLIATNPSGTVGAAVDHTFIYETSGGPLPDNRAYEMVTPPQKNGALIGDVFAGLQPNLAADGSRVFASSIQCFADAASCNGQHGDGVGSSYSFTRTTGGWQAAALAPSATEFSDNTPWDYAAGTGAALFSMPTPPSGEDDFYLRQADGTFVDVGPITPPSSGAQGPGGGRINGTTQAQTADLSHFVWQDTNPNKWPFDATTGASAYEYAGTGNDHPLLLGVTGGFGSTDLVSVCGTRLGSSSNENPPGIISADGSTVYFTAEGGLHGGTGAPCPGGSGANAAIPVPANALYARIDGELPTAHTAAISQRSPTDCSGACLTSPPGDAHFEGASADGSKAFFTSTQQLTDGGSEDNALSDSATANDRCAATSGPNGCNLYLYDFSRPAGHELTTVSAGDTSGHGPRVQGVMALSPDGSHVYFVAQGVLANTPNAQGQTAADGADNLYAYDTTTAQMSFIAALPNSDKSEWDQVPGTPANVSPDGNVLLFTSSGRLTPDDSSLSGARQIFRYDALTGQLIRISTGNAGFNDNGNRAGATPCDPQGCSEDATIPPPAFFNDLNGRGDPAMSDDGSFVFFQSPVALTPRALDDVRIGTNSVNNPIYAQNVYEWHAGHVSLISDGRDTSLNGGQAGNCPGAQLGTPSSVCLLGTDATGQNVFFTTVDQLVPQDTDTELDYYDARIGGGFPFTPLPVPCNGDNCKPSPSAAAGDQTPGSSALNGPGNSPTSTKCKKGQIRKHGKCVKKHKARTHHKKKADKSHKRAASHKRGGHK
jgi:hypothetical protein